MLDDQVKLDNKIFKKTVVGVDLKLTQGTVNQRGEERLLSWALPTATLLYCH